MKDNRLFQISLISSPPSLSKSRQEIFLLQKQTYRLLSDILSRKLLFNGTLSKVGRKCGKPNCKCANSEYRHISWYLMRYEKGKMKTYYIKDSYIDVLLKLTDEYLKFRSNKYQIAAIYKKINRLISKIEKIKLHSSWKKFIHVKKTKRKLPAKR